MELHERSWSCTGTRGVAQVLVELHKRSWSCSSARGVACVLVELHERSWSCTSARGVAQALVQCSSDFLTFLAPHRLSVQKVQTSSITLNCVQVSPPPPNRITTPYSFPVLPQADKEFTIQVNLHD